MVISEIKNGLTTVRIHDGFCRKEVYDLMEEISWIVSQSYQRRKLDGESSI